MRAQKALALFFAAIVSAAVAASPAFAAPPSAPAWAIQALATPTNFAPGEAAAGNREPNYQVFIANSGAAPTDGSPIRITDTLPAGLTVKRVGLDPPRAGLSEEVCETEVSGEISTVSCEVTEADKTEPPNLEPARLSPDDQMILRITVAVPASATFGTLVNQVEVKGGGAEAVGAEGENQVGGEDAKAGFEEFRAEVGGADGRPASGAASRPYQYTTSFGVNVITTPTSFLAPFVPAESDLKEIEVALPPGLAANPTATERCTAQQFTTHHSFVSSVNGRFVNRNECPIGSAVGVADVEQLEGESFGGLFPIYSMVPPKGMPAQFAFEISSGPIYINTRIRSDGDYGATAYLHNVTEARRVTASRITFWGVPWDASHDPLRGECTQSWELCPVEGGTPRPFFRLPSSCDSPLSTTMSFETWSQPPIFARASDTEPAPTECDKPPFDPAIESRPTTNVADAPSGLHFGLHLPQAENEDPEGLGEADLKDTRVVLPAGLLVNPASADGLAACSLAQIGYSGELEGHPSFTAQPANCPDAAKIGSVEIEAPAVDHPLPGSVYLAKQGENPFNSLIAIYIAVHDPQSGVVVKLAGKVTPDPATGQLTTTVASSPQVPFEDFHFDFFEGARAPLRTPAVCGTHTTTTSLTPWSAPASGPAATPSDSFQTTQSPSGGTCPTSAAALPNNPRFEAGSQSPIAGAYTPFVVHLSRQDGSQELKGLNLTLPAGMAAKFAGVAECSDVAIASAETKTGKQEQATPSCPSSSHLGTVTVGAGAGPAPYYVKGDAYLAGPFKGAPLSMAIITPAVAGPFDLGTVVVRAPLYIDPETAQGTVKSTFPTILQGIPLDVRSIAVSIDRQDFTLNPTSCEAKAVTGEAISTQGQSVPLNNRFQVGGCQNLGFKPKLSLKLTGGTKRGAHPSLRATLTYPKGGAYSNIAYAQVALPHSEFLDQGHIGTVCTRVQFAAKACPAKSVYGYAKAITPLFEQPLQGPVYLRSSNNQLPDLVADLNGQVNVVLDGKNDSIHGGIRNTFQAVPDAPVSKFTLTLKGAKKGLLQNSTDICVGTHKANARFVAHNGKVVVLRPQLVASCGGKGRKGAKKHRRSP
jgi:hypothetical protein